MKVGIHKENFDKKALFLTKYAEILRYNNIDFIWLDINDPDFWDKIKTLDLFIFRWRHYDNDRNIAKTILPVIEYQLNVKVFPNQKTCWHFDDKIRQYYIFKSKSLPFIKCWIFWTKTDADKWVETAEYPVVFKLKGGAGSSNVVKIESKSQAKTIIGLMFGKGVQSGQLPVRNSTKSKDFKLNKVIRIIAKRLIKLFKGEDLSEFWQKDKNYVLFQKYLPDNKFDTRITVIGNRAFGFRRMMRENDFRASGSGNINYDKDRIDMNCVKTAFKISAEMGFQSMAYDFLYNEKNEPEVCEISYTYQDKAVYTCSGYWDKDLNWHEGHFWPQFCQLADLLNLSELKQPAGFDIT